MDAVSGWVRNCRSRCVLTGAVVSAESGVPTFRGKSGEILPALFGHPKSS
jgi:NAD-dependent SIR2 family protein deacetylase